MLIDNNLGHMAKDILFADSVDRVAEVMRKHPQGDGELTLERIVPGVAAVRIDAAIELTETTLEPSVSDDFAPLRALAMLRVDEVSHVLAVPERDEMPREERDRLRDEFLSSPEGKDFASNSDEAWAASPAIDSAPTTSTGARCVGARWSSSCSWPTGFRGRCSPTKVCSNAFRRRSTPGCGSRAERRTRPIGRSTRLEGRSHAGATRWSSAAAIRRLAARRGSS